MWQTIGGKWGKRRQFVLQFMRQCVFCKAAMFYSWYRQFFAGFIKRQIMAMVRRGKYCHGKGQLLPGGIHLPLHGSVHGYGNELSC